MSFQEEPEHASPLWLLSPPDGEDVPPPSEARLQVLPFENLSWENFERLSLRLARLEGEAEYWQLYGRRGQKQDGIDIFVRMSSGRYHVWQAKRWDKFSRSNLRDAVHEFLSGKWKSKSDQLVLCVKDSLRDSGVSDEIEDQAAKLKTLDIKFIPLGGDELSERLKLLPEIVDDFFGREWVRLFCGEEATGKLQTRLTIEDVRKLRASLKTLYHHHFNRADPGFLASPDIVDISRSQLHLENRFVTPDVVQENTVTSFVSRSVSSRVPEELDQRVRESDDLASERQETVSREVPEQAIRQSTEVISSRRPVFEWIVQNERIVVLGGPGAGKSALLRMIALEVLSDEPRLEAIARKWAGFLALWIPFSLWTRLVEKDGNNCSLKDAARTWLDRLSAPPGLWGFVEKSLEDKRLLLFIDGIDEWANEQAAHTTANLLQTFVATHEVPAIVSSRPLGFRRLTPFDDTWQIAELAPFTRDQQLEFARHWFAHYYDTPASANTEDNTLADPKSLASRRAEAFVRDLHERPKITRLAETPLLLWGLISLAITQVQLPTNRFKAYEKLTEVLLRIHPTRRRESTLEGSERSRLSEDTREKALACLAYHMHSDP
jgi:hypothetical protein